MSLGASVRKYISSWAGAAVSVSVWCVWFGGYRYMVGKNMFCWWLGLMFALRAAGFVGSSEDDCFLVGRVCCFLRIGLEVKWAQMNVETVEKCRILSRLQMLVLTFCVDSMRTCLRLNKLFVKHRNKEFVCNYNWRTSPLDNWRYWSWNIISKVFLNIC